MNHWCYRTEIDLKVFAVIHGFVSVWSPNYFWWFIIRFLEINYGFDFFPSIFDVINMIFKILITVIFLLCLTYSFLMHPFSSPWRHHKTLWFSFSGVEKGCTGNEWIQESWDHISIIFVIIVWLLPNFGVCTFYKFVK